MAELLKNYYSENFVKSLSNQLANLPISFNKKKFEGDVLHKKWENFELKERMHHITEIIHNHLPYAYNEQLELLHKIADKFTGLTGFIFPNFVEKYGIDNPELSIKSLEYFTPFSTSEFAIRPFLKKYPDTIETLYKWSKHKNHHVRRLASEGCRPLLPWAMKLEQYIVDPKPILPILEQLKNDKEDYVYRSVANNMNDISKHHPELVLQLSEKWIGKSQTTDWVIKHGLRTLLKKGNQRAMGLFGFSPSKKINIIRFKIVLDKIKIGDATYFELVLNNTGKSEKIRIEYAIDYLKKNGSLSKKVFKISEKNIANNETLSLKRKIDFKDLTTRKHYPGIHYLSIIINGIETKKIAFNLS